MANLRVVYDNAADRASSITASTTAGSLTTANLKTDYKSEIWRSTATTATLTIQWASAEMVGMLALAFCNLTSAATFRVRCYYNATDPSPAIDKTAYACPGVDFSNMGWGTEPLGVNAYSYGGGTYGAIWFATGTYQKIVLDITDVIPAGYIEASRLVCGRYWSPAYNAESGAQVSMVDNSKQERTDAGDLRTDRGTVAKAMSFDLNYLTATDRNSLWNILRGNGTFKPVYVSLLPESTDDQTGEQVYQVYGKLTKQAAIKYNWLNSFSSQLELEEI
jgi:hypothetical protein